MEKRLMMFIAGLFLSMGVALAQTQVNGTVTSADDGEPVIGASVLVEGTKTGTVTDINGNFQLSAPAGSTLVVSYLGMESQKVKAGNNLSIALHSDSRSLDEVIVTGYGTYFHKLKYLISLFLITAKGFVNNFFIRFLRRNG